VKDTLPYPNPIASAARDLASSATFGERNIVVVCPDARKRHLLAVALLEWCEDRGWGCFEHEPQLFTLRRATVRIVGKIDKAYGLVEVRAVEKMERD